MGAWVSIEDKAEGTAMTPKVQAVGPGTRLLTLQTLCRHTVVTGRNTSSWQQMHWKASFTLLRKTWYCRVGMEGHISITSSQHKTETPAPFAPQQH